MKTIFATLQHKRLRIGSAAVACVLAATALFAQGPAPRIQSDIDNSQMTAIQGSKHPLATAQNDAGRLPGETKLSGITINFNRSAAQQADLNALIAAQQDSASSLYHQWLTPDQFATRFGMAGSDIDAVSSWLQQQGFSIDSVNRSHNAIHFSGSVAQVESAFSTQMHYYNFGGRKHFAPSTALSVPAAMAGVVAGVGNLNDFRPRSMAIRSTTPRIAKPQYTACSNSSCTASEEYTFFAPGDIDVAYDINPLLSASNNGSGQTIAIMGQSAITTQDITNFQQAAGLTVKAPDTILVPNTGPSTVYADGDEGESDLDLEWSGATAPGATIDFVYTGSSSNAGVFDAYQYAVDEKIGNIISLSYGSCETELASTDFTTYEGVGAQAIAQGQTVLASSGDSGATGCYGYTGMTDSGTTFTTAMQDALTVNYPASSAYVTGVGGTEISAADDAVGTYWTSASTSTDILLTSATQYIPEIAWNDDSLSAVSGCNSDNTYLCVSASGGGISANIKPQPSWQTGYFTATGEANPSGSYRLVPDVALYASPNYPGYLFCTSDESDWASGQEASCGNSQFYDSVTSYFTLAGGTSFAAPIFAGMLAIVNQAKSYSTGQGLANTELYKLAENSTSYASAFHDVTSGSNKCTESSSYCPSSGGYSAGTGYDLVTGLGSVDLNNLVTAYATGTSTLIGTTTSVTPSNTTPLVNTSDSFTITVTPASGTVTPTGTVAISVDGGTAVSETLTSNGTYVYAYTFTGTGSHTLTVAYSGDTTYAPSTGSVTVTVGASSSGTGTFTLAATPSTLTVAQGSSGTETIGVTPSTSPAYSGTVDLNIDFGSSDNSLQNLCAGFGGSEAAQGSLVVGGTGPFTTSLTLDTNANDCASDAVAAKKGLVPLRVFLNKHATAKNTRLNPLPEGVAFAGLLLIGFLGRRSRKLRGLVAVLLLATAGLAISACGSSTVSTTVTDPPKGTYTGTITGNDSVTTSIKATTTFTFVIN